MFNIEENEAIYGKEIREKYGDAVMDAANAHIEGLDEKARAEGERLRVAVEKALAAAVRTGEPGGVLARKVCDYHKQWLMVYYPNYSKEYHIALAHMYAEDERFKDFYDKITPGCAEFLRDAIISYCE